MNLILHGSHESADWLLYKLRARRGPVALHVEDNCDLTTRDARNCKGGESLLGVYRLPVDYVTLVADLQAERERLLADKLRRRMAVAA